jgi:hypothetical protein
VTNETGQIKFKENVMSAAAPVTSTQAGLTRKHDESKPLFTFSQKSLVNLLNAMIPMTFDPLDLPHLPRVSVDDVLWLQRQREKWRREAMVGHHLPDPPVPPHYRSPGKPHPGLIAALARTLIESMVSQYDLAEAISIAPEQSRKATDLFRKRITRLGRGGLRQRAPQIEPACTSPTAEGGEPRPIHPTEILAVGVEFDRATRRLGNHPLQEAFAAAAGRILGAGLKEMDEVG